MVFTFILLLSLGLMVDGCSLDPEYKERVDLTITPGDQQLTVAWESKADPDCTQGWYNLNVLDENVEPAGFYSQVFSPYTVTGLTNGKNYILRVDRECITGNGTEIKPYSKPGLGTPNAPIGISPEVIDLLWLTAYEGYAEMGWSEPSDLSSTENPTTHFLVCNIIGGPLVRTPTCEEVPATETRHTVRNLTEGENYCFGVKQVKEGLGASPDYGVTKCVTILTTQEDDTGEDDTGGDDGGCMTPLGLPCREFGS